MRKNRLQAFRSLGTAGILMLTMWLVIFTGQTVHAAAKPVKKVTVKAGETYNIVVTGKCSAYQNTRRAVLQTKKAGTVYDVVFYSGSAGQSSVMKMNMTQKKLEVGLDYLGGGYMPKGYDWSSDPAKQLVASVQVKKGSLSFALYGGFQSSESVTFIPQKVKNTAYRTYTLKKGVEKKYSLGKQSVFAPTSIEAVFKAAKGTTLTFSGEYDTGSGTGTWVQTVVFKNKYAEVNDARFDQDGNAVSSYDDKWTYTETDGKYRYLQYINVDSFGKIKASKKMEMIVPYVMKLTNK